MIPYCLKFSMMSLPVTPSGAKISANPGWNMKHAQIMVILHTFGHGKNPHAILCIYLCILIACGMGSLPRFPLEYLASI